MIVGVSKDVRHEIRATFNRNFANILRPFCSSNSAKLENGNPAEDRVRFRKKRLFCKICRPHRAVGVLLVDWIFLAGLGVAMAVLSLILDYGVDKLQTYHVVVMERFNLTKDPTINTLLTYAAWLIYAMMLLMLATTIVHYLSINAMGSGIPEVKTMLQGVHLEKHLTFRTLLSKLIGLMLAIGSGFPIGKEGPFVHMGSIVAHQMRRMVVGIKPAYANESRSYELLAAGCAAGVAATFSAPVGGVLFSIEVTTAYFAVRDYWRGFFAAACGAATFSLLRLWIDPFEVTLAALFQTKFRHRSYYPEELLIFACIGWIVYPLTISMLYSTITYPHGLGQYLSRQTVFARSLRDFFANCTWHVNPLHVEACNEFSIVRWKIYDSVFVELAVFIYFLVIIANTLPVPAGIFMPAFVIGAAMGRFIGELMAFAYPNGFRNDQKLLILPGIYSVVGAVSFCGAVTHTVSVSVIAFELTGQLLHILPVMVIANFATIAVLLSNIVCSSLQPSFFDSIIKIKHLPYFPDMPKTTSWVHEIRVEQIMVRNVKYLTKQSTYDELQELLTTTHKLLAYPLVDNPSSMILLGSVSRENLLRLLNKIVGDEARHAEYLRRMQSQRNFDKTTKDDESCKAEGIVKFSICSVFPKAETQTDAEDIQRSRTGSLELGKNQELKLKSSVSEYDVRKSKEALHKENLNQLGKSHSGHDFRETLGSMFEKITQTFRVRKRGEPEDLSKEERQIWEKEQLSKEIDYSQTTIDLAPFQLVEDTSLYKVHSIFSLLSIRRAYVTKCGVLVGVVAAKEITSAIERIQAGTLTAVTKRSEQDEYDKIGTTNGTFDSTENSETDTDNEDIILPRVEFGKNTSSEFLEAKFAALQASIGRENILNKNRRKSCPHFRRGPCSNLKVSRHGRQSCDIILEKISNEDEQEGSQNTNSMMKRFRRLRDWTSESQRRAIPFMVEKALTKLSSQENSDSSSELSDQFPVSSNKNSLFEVHPKKSEADLVVEKFVSQQTAASARANISSTDHGVSESSITSNSRRKMADEAYAEHSADERPSISLAESEEVCNKNDEKQLITSSVCFNEDVLKKNLNST
uniref:Chloride channel protein n=1 Tax=Setaria digitata TaxID=48799 RepID=A0A915PI94_9BILA